MAPPIVNCRNDFLVFTNMIKEIFQQCLLNHFGSSFDASNSNLPQLLETKASTYYQEHRINYNSCLIIYYFANCDWI